MPYIINPFTGEFDYYQSGGGGGGSGTVTSVSVASINGFAGTVANPTTTPAITLSTSITGILKGNGTAISAATANTDYQSPITLTTTGTSGAATFTSNTLNIPQYSGQTPGGSTGQLQYNSSGSFAGVANSHVDSNGYIFPRNIFFTILGNAIVGNDVASNWVVCTQAGKFVSCYASAKTAPTGASLIFDIQKSTNNGSSFTSIWSVTPSNKITIAAAAHTGNTSSFDTATFAVGDLLRFDVDQIGSSVAGANIGVYLLTQTMNS